MRMRCKCIVIIVLSLLLPAVATAQVFTSVRLPGEMCSGDTLMFTFGFNRTFDVVVANQRSSLSHPGRVFLPDGEPCGENGCSYRSPVTFTDFTADAAITSAQDIEYVRLNIEHSFIGDLYINITCPNGQKADLMRFGGYNDSGCEDAIPSTSIQWLSGANIGQNTYFGLPVDMENSARLCDSSAPGNEPGVGWNYCWSNNTGSFYQYASGDGIIYRTGHSHNGVVDSSVVAQGRNFYHPDDNFSALVGCPLNGSWYIEVVDGYAQDNGYIFDWELSLNASLLPTPCVIAERMVYNPYVNAINDSTYLLALPPMLVDTTIRLTLAMVNSCGDTIDTTVAIHVNPIAVGEDSAKVCDVYTWAGVDYYADTTVLKHLRTTENCDSLVSVALTIMPSYDEMFYDTVCATKGVVFEDVFYDEEGIYVHRYTTVDGCDSILSLNLTIIGNDLKAKALISPRIVTSENLTVRLHDVSTGACGRLWQMGDGETCTDERWIIKYPAELDSLPITLVAISKLGCTDTLKEMIYIDRATFFTPNVFTPDKETNNRWRPAMYDIDWLEVTIYDRQGRQVYAYEGVDGSWDGTCGGAPCQQGAYVFVARYRSRLYPDRVQITQGTITLLR